MHNRREMLQFCSMIIRLCMDWRTVRYDWNRARAFLVTAEEGSLSAAARALGMSQPTLSRQIAALERELGVALFDRVGNRLALTQPGLGLLEHARAMGEAAVRLSLAAAGQSDDIEGSVRITASQLISAHLLPPLVARVRREHPRITLEIAASNAVRDLRRREADIAVRNVAPSDPELFARRLPDAFARPYAAPGYLESVGWQGDLQGLALAELFGFEDVQRMISFMRALGVDVTARNFPVITDDHLVQWEMARRGLGICIVMEQVGDAEPLVERLSGFPPIPVQMWLVSHRELQTSRRIRVVFDLLAELLAGS